jgi:mRNA-degrading endonuclease RelE of RelBE toxin-antitoxin system
MSLTWKVLYHPEVDKDLRRIGKSRAKRAMKAIDEKPLTSLKLLAHRCARDWRDCVN